MLISLVVTLLERKCWSRNPLAGEEIGKSNLQHLGSVETYQAAPKCFKFAKRDWIQSMFRALCDSQHHTSTIICTEKSLRTNFEHDVIKT